MNVKKIFNWIIGITCLAIATYVWINSNLEESWSWRRILKIIVFYALGIVNIYLAVKRKKQHQ